MADEIKITGNRLIVLLIGTAIALIWIMNAPFNWKAIGAIMIALITGYITSKTK